MSKLGKSTDTEDDEDDDEDEGISVLYLLICYTLSMYNCFTVDVKTKKGNCDTEDPTSTRISQSFLFRCNC